MSYLNTRVLYKSNRLEDAISVSGSDGQQVVLMHAKYQDSHYVLLLDKNMGTMYIERLKSSLRVDIYASENFDKIEDDEEWKSVYNALDLVES